MFRNWDSYIYCRYDLIWLDAQMHKRWQCSVIFTLRWFATARQHHMHNHQNRKKNVPAQGVATCPSMAQKLWRGDIYMWIVKHRHTWQCVDTKLDRRIINTTRAKTPEVRPNRTITLHTQPYKLKQHNHRSYNTEHRQCIFVFYHNMAGQTCSATLFH